MGIHRGEIKEHVRVLVAACLYYSGLVKLAHWWTRHSGQRLIILNYHRATGGGFASATALPAPSLSPHTSGGCNRGILLTIFLIPGYIESGEPFWWREGERLVRNAKVDKVALEGRTYHLGELEERRALVHLLDVRAGHARSVAERETFLADMRKAVGVPSSVEEEEEGALPLTWAQVRKMEESGLVSFGAHTIHHPILGYLADPAEVQQEVGECHRAPEQQLGLPVRTFAYPVGKLEHIGTEGLRAVKEAGYRWSLTTIEEINNPQTDPSLLRRLPGIVTLNWRVMVAELVGLLGVVSRLRKKYRAWAGISEDGEVAHA